MRKKTLRKQVGVYSYAQVKRQDVNQLYILFESNEIEAILLVDTENAFDLINRKALCLIIAMFLYNCFAVSTRLFNIGGK